MTKQFTNFILKSRWHATLLALLCSIVPGFGWLSAVIVGVVTLRIGVLEGFIVLLWSALPAIAISVDSHSIWPVLINVILGSYLVWLVAIQLRRGINWSLLLEFLAIFAAVGVIVTHLLFPGIETFWINHLTTYYQDFVAQIGVSVDGNIIKEMIQKIAPYITGIVAAFVLFSAVVELIIARSLLSVTFGSGVAKREWITIRVNKIFAIIAIVMAILAAMNIWIIKDILPAILVVFFVAGISFVHFWLCYRKATLFTVVMFYVLVFTTAMVCPLCLGAFVLLAILDSFINIRIRLRS